MLEIYNDNIKDLLVSKEPENAKYNINHDSQGNTTVSELKLINVTSQEQVSGMNIQFTI